MPLRDKKPKRLFRDPRVRAFTDATEIPDSFLGAVEFRRAGYRTYLAILKMPREELAALEETIGSEVAAAILALRRSD